jgi:hypothetical protein
MVKTALLGSVAALGLLAAGCASPQPRAYQVSADRYKSCLNRATSSDQCSAAEAEFLTDVAKEVLDRRRDNDQQRAWADVMAAGILMQEISVPRTYNVNSW